MQVHNIKNEKKQKQKKRVGRGGGRGTYSGRGIKGQKARAGARIRPEVWDYIGRIPKQKGPTNKAENAKGLSKVVGGRSSFQRTVTTGLLNKHVKDGDVVNKEFLLKNNIIEKYKGRTPDVKVLVKGHLDKKITVEGLQLSKKARDIIEKTGGKVK